MTRRRNTLTTEKILQIETEEGKIKIITFIFTSTITKNISRCVCISASPVLDSHRGALFSLGCFCQAGGRG